MRPVFIISFVLTFLLIACKNPHYRKPESVDLSGGWRFRQGDDLAYSNAAFNDSRWDTIKSDKSWNSQGYGDYYGWGWYRSKFFLSRHIKDPYARDSVEVSLGIIGENDEVFLNGNLIGENGNIQPAGHQPDTNYIRKFLGFFPFRNYLLAVSDRRLKWDQMNSIAIRVYSESDGGGLVGGRMSVFMKDISGYLSFDRDKFYNINQQTIDSTLVLKNRSTSVRLHGDFICVVTGNVLHGDSVIFKRSNIDLPPRGTASISMSLPYSTDPLSLKLSFHDISSNTLIADEFELPFVLNK